MVEGLEEGYSDEEMLKILELTTLGTRITRFFGADLIEVFKIWREFENGFFQEIVLKGGTSYFELEEQISFGCGKDQVRCRVCEEWNRLGGMRLSLQGQ